MWPRDRDPAPAEHAAWRPRLGGVSWHRSGHLLRRDFLQAAAVLGAAAFVAPGVGLARPARAASKLRVLS
ncbi:MAG: twin-arginine translocation signal domain-containing protein [Phycisphaeraceae bacterium]|nr:twin-arginine translocation signal domain-containing protein [Phycisphaeraceae bacterium]